MFEPRRREGREVNRFRLVFGCALYASRNVVMVCLNGWLHWEKSQILRGTSGRQLEVAVAVRIFSSGGLVIVSTRCCGCGGRGCRCEGDKRSIHRGDVGGADSGGDEAAGE